jgi:hypothetical protein
MNFSPAYVCAGEGGGGEWELAEEWSAHQKVQVRGSFKGMLQTQPQCCTTPCYLRL